MLHNKIFLAKVSFEKNHLTHYNNLVIRNNFILIEGNMFGWNSTVDGRFNYNERGGRIVAQKNYNCAQTNNITVRNRNFANVRGV
jgi:hypothetical protein